MKRFLTAIMGLALVLAPVQVLAGSVAFTATDKGTFTSGNGGGIRVIEFTFDYLDLDGLQDTSASDSSTAIFLDKPYRVIGVDWQPDTGSAGGATGDLTEVPDDDGDIEIRSTITGVDILNGAGDDVPATSSDGDELFRVPADSKSSGYIITRIDEGLYIYASNMNNTHTNAKGKYYLYLQQL